MSVFIVIVVVRLLAVTPDFYRCVYDYSKRRTRYALASFTSLFFSVSVYNAYPSLPLVQSALDLQLGPVYEFGDITAVDTMTYIMCVCVHVCVFVGVGYCGCG